MEANPYLQINFFETFYKFIQKLFVSDLNDAETSICDDETSKSFEKLYLENTRRSIIKHHKFYEFGVIPARILVEIELKLTPFVKKS